MSSLSKEDVESIFTWAEKLTGSCQSESFRRDVIVTHVERRMIELGVKRLTDYLKLTEESREEKAEFVSRLTIHTTSWFRESPHYDLLVQRLESWKPEDPNRKFVAWSVAASTGEEGYGIGLVLENHRRKNPGFEYEVYFSDVDPRSLEKGRRALYSAQDLNRIPALYHSLVRIGSGKTQGWLTVDPEIRKRSKFGLNNLNEMSSGIIGKPVDFLMCRNVLIYFSEVNVKRIVETLLTTLSDVGTICFGHSEALDHTPSGFRSLGHASYKRKSASLVSNGHIHSSLVVPAPNKRRVLIVDDSVVIRKVLSRTLENAGIEVVDVESGPLAREVLKTKTFDLITLDLHMPEEDGSVWLEERRRNGLTIPVLIVTDADPKESNAVIRALEKGAQDYFLKSNLAKNPELLIELVNCLMDKDSGTSTLEMKMPTAIDRPQVIVVGASTGGPQALCTILNEMPSHCPPVLVVQHINKVFTRPFAERLSQVAHLPLGEIKEGSVLEDGKLYMALDDHHIGIQMKGIELALKIDREKSIYGHMPSVDFLFRSVATHQVRALSILLTGMGKDGSAAMAEIKRLTKSFCVIQDEKSSIVYGMPKEAATLGAFHFQGDLKRIKEVLDLACISKKKLLKVG